MGSVEGRERFGVKRGGERRRTRAMFNNNTIIIKKSGKQYVSLCLENMVVGCGMSKEEAIENLKNAIRSYVDSTEDGMTLERPISLKLLHEFLAEEDGEREVDMNEEVSGMRILTYG